ncbi:MAG: LysR family transcriptional regulator [Hydrogenophaga sp.]|uniref:LysR substrate-binding domain-containing protein n=1 Tax=Hydrogenophaga sp. TaxID=1904254 RepID=UPI0025BDDED4|nr:LysR substrate-binding domain-containing protein [Hydrogenophaga sp.]MBU7574621.1 LysR family transcriptional regulator [Hydrogenophaga sp.]
MDRQDDTRTRLRALRTVEATHEGGSAAAAALLLHVSTSTVSRTIQQAEQALQVGLFERGTRGMVCTTPGLAVVRGCVAVRAELMLSVTDGVSSAQRQVESLFRVLTVPMLRCFVACAELANETLAARSLGLSQPAVSQQLRSLHRAYGRPLMQRTQRGLRLTRDGQRVLGPLKRVLSILRVLEEQMSAYRGEASGRLHLGVLPMASTSLAPQALAGLLQRMPKVVVTVSDGTYEAMARQLKTGDLDMILGPLRGELVAPELEERELFQESLIAVVRPGHALASARRRLALRQLRSLAWIAPLENTPAHAAFERAFRAAGVPLPEASFHANSPSLVRALLMKSDHIALMSPLQVQEDLESGALVRVPVTLHEVDRRIGITVRRAFAWPPACVYLWNELSALSVSGSLSTGTSRWS